MQGFWVGFTMPSSKELITNISLVTMVGILLETSRTLSVRQ